MLEKRALQQEETLMNWLMGMEACQMEWEHFLMERLFELVAKRVQCVSAAETPEPAHHPPLPRTAVTPSFIPDWPRGEHWASKNTGTPLCTSPLNPSFNCSQLWTATLVTICSCSDFKVFPLNLLPHTFIKSILYLTECWSSFPMMNWRSLFHLSRVHSEKKHSFFTLTNDI